MRRPAFYSRSPRTLPQAADPAADEAAVPSPEGAAGNGAPPPPHAKAGWQPISKAINSPPGSWATIWRP